MELKAIDYSQVVYLTSVYRRQGQLFLPKAGFDLVARYFFQKVPTQEELLGDKLIFKQGVFKDVGITEFGIYSDGMVVNSRATTDFLDGFLADLLAWATEHLGLVENGIPPRETHYESAVIFSSAKDFNAAFAKFEPVAKTLNAHQIAYGLRPFSFDFHGIGLAVDQTLYAGRKPAAFSIARRVNVPHSANIYYSVAPLKTDDHLHLLEQVEGILD